MESDDAVRRHEATDAIRGAARAREKLAERVTAPWWYTVGVALSVFAIFLGLGLVEGLPGLGDQGTAGNALIAAGAVIAPVALVSALKNATGVSTDRYANGLGWWYAVAFVLLALGFALQAYADVPFALPVAGVVALVATVMRERQIDTVLRRSLTHPAVESPSDD